MLVFKQIFLLVIFNAVLVNSNRIEFINDFISHQKKPANIVSVLENPLSNYYIFKLIHI